MGGARERTRGEAGEERGHQGRPVCSRQPGRPQTEACILFDLPLNIPLSCHFLVSVKFSNAGWFVEFYMGINNNDNDDDGYDNL